MSQLNPVSPENLRDPVPLYRELRENHPVHWVEEIQSWLVTRHDDVINCFRSPDLSADRSKFFELQFRMLGLELKEAQLLVDTVRRQMVNQDGAAHIRLRRQASVGFMPQLIDSWRPAIRGIMNKLMDEVQQRGHMDLVQQVSYQLPAQVIAEVLGIPVEDRESFQEWTQPIFQLSSPTVGTDMIDLVHRSEAAMHQFDAYLRNLIAERRRNPGPDIISHMTHFQGPGQMSEDELVANSALILSAGHATTTDQISNGVYELLTHPDQLQLLRSNPNLMKPAVDEIMRFNPTMPFINRFAIRDFQLRGQTIRAGQMVFLGMASANRDPSVFEDPDRFDITRDSTQHKNLSFSFGPHHCLGAVLARHELELTFEVLLERLPALRLDESNPPKLKSDTLLFRGFNSLPLRW
ncbi:hypothetical protein BO221_50920 [Archangium sp. Cb G35]|uniref:cytochrome P450 n=1 Tax=Archangium sp. Cb G35 TaxID=1920190 RepID=UPI0009686AD9|nr:cytochrome P450 [Archangium sp. Cb G35]OJT16277.1 hypothetical protein BO221_50920 [Archangium sp. Cb G35]